jgi:hypothetical protein
VLQLIVTSLLTPEMSMSTPVLSWGGRCLTVCGRGWRGQACWHHRQDRRGSIQRLDLAVLVHAQHHRPLRRIQIQPHDIAHLVDEQWGLAQLPWFLPAVAVRTHARSARPWTVSTRVRPRASGSTSGWRWPEPFQCSRDHGLDLPVGDGTGTAGSWFVGQPVQPLGKEPAPPFRALLSAMPSVAAIAVLPRPSAAARGIRVEFLLGKTGKLKVLGVEDLVRASELACDNARLPLAKRRGGVSQQTAAPKVTPVATTEEKTSGRAHAVIQPTMAPRSCPTIAAVECPSDSTMSAAIRTSS